MTEIGSAPGNTSIPTQSIAGSGPRWAELLTVIALSFCLAFASAVVARARRGDLSLFSLSNLVGPTTQSMLQGKGMLVCTDAGTPGNPICFHSARMPMASLVVGGGIELFGNRFFPVDILKMVFFLVPLWIAMYCVWRACSGQGRLRIFALLLLPFVVTGFLADVVALQVEEGYCYSLLALTMAIILFLTAEEKRRKEWLLCFVLCVDALFLAKSSMILVAPLFVLVFCLSLRRARDIITVVVLVAAAPLVWGVVQHHASGHFTFGTSLDGINLHKGNNAAFFDHYPPAPGTSLDQFDVELNRGLHFSDEWSFDAFHKQAAVAHLS